MQKNNPDTVRYSMVMLEIVLGIWSVLKMWFRRFLDSYVVIMLQRMCKNNIHLNDLFSVPTQAIHSLSYLIFLITFREGESDKD